MEAVTARLSRLRALELSPAAFLWLAGLSAAALWLIVSTGAVVFAAFRLLPGRQCLERLRLGAARRELRL